jgi:hypothetical protein
LIALVRLSPSVALSERAFRALLFLVEGSRRYRAEKDGRSYVPREPSWNAPPEQWSRVHNTVMLLTYVVVCIGAIAVAMELDD